MEIWKIINDFEMYEVSNYGRVRNIRTGRIRKTRIKNNGYEIVDLCNEKGVFTRHIHRLVGEAFLPNPNNLPEINHIDENKLNNNVNNLEWTTHHKNIYHSIDKMGGPKKIKCIETGVIYKSITEAANDTGIERRGINRVVVGKGKTAGGYHWEYVV